ncbi:hypothetical protein PLICRDRAFT_698005 [Plicaturopsis crispa FD-325 SS-3]|nr:hypothetical protein PLICRDRAFT_698005 [Plicaturopsis crispa FD-325 SS-3]
MHPFGGSPICPRCEKAVYAAEQVMGPGRKLYHKPCLACMSCNKRLDSFTLLEHDQQPYCKPCHSKHFGTRDLRQANLPHRGDLFSSNPSSPNTSPGKSNIFPAASPLRTQSTGGVRSGATSPFRPGTISPTRAISPTRTGAISPSRNGAASPVRAHTTGTGASGRTFPSPSPIALRSHSTGTPTHQILRPTRALSPTSERFPNGVSQLNEEDEDRAAKQERYDEDRYSPAAARPQTPPSPIYEGTTTHVGRGAGGLPRTVPLSPSKERPTPSSSPAKDVSALNGGTVTPIDYGSPRREFASATVGRATPTPSPLVPTATGTRYGAALGGTKPLVPNPTGGRVWGGGVPKCGRCGQSVYFAEQVKAIGKTWHKSCLRCTECGSSLAPNRLTEKDGDPLCHRCYGKLHGPQGSGYALLGKAGG